MRTRSIIGGNPAASHTGPSAANRSRTPAVRSRLRCAAALVAGLGLWLSGGGCKRSDPAAPEEPQQPAARASWFVDVTDRLGPAFVHEAGDTGRWHMPEIMGGGAALFDADNDGRLDVYFINGAYRWGGGEPGKAPPVNRFFRQDSAGRFMDATDESGLGDPGYGMGVAIGDIDNDGDVDVFVTNEGPDRLYRNRGNGTFEDVTREAGVDVPYWSASASFLDYDRDGFLDLYVTRYVQYDPTRQCFDGIGRPDYCGPRSFPYLSDVLLRNNGDGTFTDVSEPAGIAGVRAPGLGVVCEDLNDDGWIDVYAANDMEANQLWLNQHDGTFRDDAVILGAAFDLNGQAESGMGVLAADLDGDLRPDLFMTHLQGQTNTVYRNLGPNMGFADETGRIGLAEGCLRYTGFGTVALDVELDGDLDLLIANGKAFRGDPIPGVRVPPPWSFFAEPNLFYVNDAGGFTLAADRGGAFCSPIEVGRGLAVGDVDSDGDLDVLLANIDGPARLYRNDAPARGHWLNVRAWDPRLNRDAIGARITLRAGDRRIARTVSAGFSYLSASEPVANFGLGAAAEVAGIQVRWPDGLLEEFPSRAGDRDIRLERGTGRAVDASGIREEPQLQSED
jgi:hypothetical protein